MAWACQFSRLILREREYTIMKRTLLFLGMFLSMTRQVLFLIPLVLILPKFFGLNGILYAAPIADFVAFVVSVICISTEFKKLNELEKSRKTNSL